MVTFLPLGFRFGSVLVTGKKHSAAANIWCVGAQPFFWCVCVDVGPDPEALDALQKVLGFRKYVCVVSCQVGWSIKAVSKRERESDPYVQVYISQAQGP